MGTESFFVENQRYKKSKIYADHIFVGEYIQKIYKFRVACCEFV